MTILKTLYDYYLWAIGKFLWAQPGVVDVIVVRNTSEGHMVMVNGTTYDYKARKRITPNDDSAS